MRQQIEDVGTVMVEALVVPATSLEVIMDRVKALGGFAILHSHLQSDIERALAQVSYEHQMAIAQ